MWRLFDFRRETWESVRPLPPLTPPPGHISYKILACLLLSFPANWPIAASQANSYLKTCSKQWLFIAQVNGTQGPLYIENK